MDEAFGHPLDGCHPGPLFFIGFGIDVEVNFRGLYSEGVGPIVLILIIGLECFDFLQGDDFGGVLVDTLLHEAIEMSFGEDHPSFLPLLEVTRPLNKEPLLDFVISDVGFDQLTALH